MLGFDALNNIISEIDLFVLNVSDKDFISLKVTSYRLYKIINISFLCLKELYIMFDGLNVATS